MAQENTEKKSKLQELYEVGKKKGVLTYKEIMEHLTESEMEPDQLDKILETLEAYGISVVNDESEISLSEDAAAEAAADVAAATAGQGEKDVPLEDQLDADRFEQPAACSSWT